MLLQTNRSSMFIITSCLKCLYSLFIGQAMNCILSLAISAIGFLINVNFQCLNWKQKTKPSVRAYAPLWSAGYFLACMWRVMQRLSSQALSEMVNGVWKHTEHLAETFRFPASVFPSLWCQGITSDDQLWSLHVEPSCWSCCQYFFYTIIFIVEDLKKPEDKNNEKEERERIHLKWKISRKFSTLQQL